MVSALVSGLLALAAPSGTVSIQHDAVACVVAGQHPRLDACVTPASNVGRAQVHFRAAGNGPWYAVDMRPNGSCLSGLLPRPLPTTAYIEYFVYAVDRQLGERAERERAPEVPHTARVVATEGGCDKGVMAAWANRAPEPVRVSVARDSGGQLVRAAGGAQAQGQALPAGFSPDGVVASGETGEAAQKAGPSRGKGMGKGTIAAVAAGVAGVGVVAAAAAGGGGNDTGGANQANGTSGPSSPSSDVSGRWSGPWASISTFSVPGAGTVSVSCVQQVTATLSQSGQVVTGTATATSGSCSGPGVQVAGDGSTGPVTGVALGGQLSLTFRLSDNFCSPGQFVGTYAGANLSGTYRMSCVAQGTPIEYDATWTARR